MADSASQPLITALDIGSSKVSALIVAPDEEGRLRVLGSGQRESRGVKRGYVTDVDASEVAVREAVVSISAILLGQAWLRMPTVAQRMPARSSHRSAARRPNA